MDDTALATSASDIKLQYLAPGFSSFEVLKSLSEEPKPLSFVELCTFVAVAVRFLWGSICVICDDLSNMFYFVPIEPRHRPSMIIECCNLYLMLEQALAYDMTLHSFYEVMANYLRERSCIN